MSGNQNEYDINSMLAIEIDIVYTTKLRGLLRVYYETQRKDKHESARQTQHYARHASG